jgi:hypothetical protein
MTMPENFTFGGSSDSLVTPTPPPSEIVAFLVPVWSPGGDDTINYTFEGESTSHNTPGQLPNPAVAYVDTSSGPVNYSLPVDHSEITVKDDSGTATAHPITVSDPGGAPIDGQPAILINQNYMALTFRWREGAMAWRIF